MAVELEEYGKGLVDKPRLLVVNKVDIPEVRQRLSDQADELLEATGAAPLALSAATGEGVGALLDALLTMVPEEAPAQAQDKRVGPQGGGREVWQQPLTVGVIKSDGEFVVECQQAERVAKVIDLNNWRVQMQFHNLLGRLGVLRELERAGVSSGDTVRIGSSELEWR